MREARFSNGRLTEAKGHAERALAIKETLDPSSQIWNTLNILADIADLEGRTDEAGEYRSRERETFAAFEGNRYHIDRQHGQLITAIAAVANGNEQAREAIEEALLEFEKNGWHIADATQRIWAGERDWHSLVEDLDRQDALLVLRVLETIAEPESVGDGEVEGRTREMVVAALPDDIREALGRGDERRFGWLLRLFRWRSSRG